LRKQETVQSIQEALQASNDIYNRKQSELSKLPEGSDDRRYTISDRRRELLDYLPGRDRDRLVSKHSGDLLDEQAMSWSDLVKAIEGL